MQESARPNRLYGQYSCGTNWGSRVLRIMIKVFGYTSWYMVTRLYGQLLTDKMVNHLSTCNSVVSCNISSPTCMASSISRPSAAFSLGMGTARRRPEPGSRARWPRNREAASDTPDTLHGDWKPLLRDATDGCGQGCQVDGNEHLCYSLYRIIWYSPLDNTIA